MRSSAIFNGPSSVAQILERTYLNLLSESQEIWLRNGSNVFQAFNASRTSRQLARDRVDWTRGRVFHDVTGLQIGNRTIDFGRVVVSSGPESESNYVNSDVCQDFSGLSNVRQNEYGVVGEVLGECPPRPSGFSSLGTSCLAIIVLECHTFPGKLCLVYGCSFVARSTHTNAFFMAKEDYTSLHHDLYYPLEASTPCRLQRVGFVWGRNFLADSELATVVAGMYGLVRPRFWDATWGPFLENSIFSALFTLATTDERPIVEEAVRPEINIIYIVFMSLPLVISFLLIAIVRWTRKSYLSIPETPWELMVMAKTEALIPARKAGSFPPLDDDLLYVIGENGPCIVRRSRQEKGLENIETTEMLELNQEVISNVENLK